MFEEARRAIRDIQAKDPGLTTHGFKLPVQKHFENQHRHVRLMGQQTNITI